MKTIFFSFVFLLITSISFSQTATIKGTVKDSNGKPIEGVSVSVKFEEIGTTTDKYGAYLLEVPVPKSKKVSIVFSHVSYNTYSKRLNVRKNGNSTFSPKLKIKTEEISDVVIDAKKKKEERKRAEGTEVLDKKQIENIPTINDGVTDLIKTIGTGVGNSGGGESSTYNVRGGNYDENLVYVNGIEVYRPFLVRSGQQEGLSFVNSDMTKNVEFSSGGFQAKYGDKLSSVLDITYRKPTKFGVKIDASLLGASATVEGTALKENKLSAILGVRYRNNSLVVNNKDIESNYKPSFTDVQTYLSYKLSNKISLDYLGNFALNNYKFTPFSRRVNFNFPETKQLFVLYNGKEIDKYLTLFNAFKIDYKISDRLKMDLTSSIYNTQEEEH